MSNDKPDNVIHPVFAGMAPSSRQPMPYAVAWRDAVAVEIAKVSAGGANRSPDAIARFAYDVADAMLVAREQTKEERQAAEDAWRKKRAANGPTYQARGTDGPIVEWRAEHSTRPVKP